MIDLIHTYSRADAINDGVLRDASSIAAGFKIRHPVAFTEAAWLTYAEFDREAMEGQGQSVAGRVCDILTMFVAAARASGGESDITFTTLIAMPDRADWKSNEAPPPRGCGVTRETHRLVTLRAVCGPGDDPRPVITIMMPDED